VALTRPAPGARQELMQLGTGERPDALGRSVRLESQRSIGGERLGEMPESRETTRVDLLAQMRELGIGAGCRCEDLEQRPAALETQDDVGGDEGDLLALVADGRDRARPRLIGDGRVVAAAGGLADHLAE